MISKSQKIQVVLICIFLFVLMIPVTALVPVLKQITNRFEGTITLFDRHLFMSVNMIGAMIFAPFAGFISDRYKKRKFFILISFILNGICLYLFTFDFSYNHYLIIRFFEGCFHISALSLLMTLASDRMALLNKPAIMGAIGSSISLGVAFGAPIGGIIGSLNYLYIFYYGAILLILSSFFIGLYLKDINQKTNIVSIKKIYNVVINKRKILIPYFFTFVDRISVGFIISTFTFYLSFELKAEPREIGMIMAIFLIPFSLLIYPAAKLSAKFNKLLLMITGSLAYGILLICIPLLNIDQIKVLMFFAGIASAIMYAPSLIMVSHISGDEDKAVAMSGFNSFGSLGFLIGPLFGGMIISQFMILFDSVNPYYPAFYFIGTIEILCAVLFIPYLIRKRVKIVD